MGQRRIEKVRQKVKVLRVIAFTATFTAALVFMHQAEARDERFVSVFVALLIGALFYGVTTALMWSKITDRYTEVTSFRRLFLLKYCDKWLNQDRIDLVEPLMKDIDKIHTYLPKVNNMKGYIKGSYITLKRINKRNLQNKKDEETRV